MRLRCQPESGATLPELMISAMIVATFFASIFEVNAICLKLVSGSKENVAAIQGVQDRLETMRNLSFTDLTNAAYLRDTVLATPSNASEFAKKVSENVTVTAYNTDNATGGTTGTGIKLVRNTIPYASTTYLGTPDPAIVNAKAVLVTVKYTWTMSLSGRQRTEETSSIVSAGIKK